MKICLLLEGSYPYITGGVSAWVHDLILNLPEFEFVLFTISPGRDQVLRYELPPNVTGHTDIVLTDHPANRRTGNTKALFKALDGYHRRDGDIGERMTALLRELKPGRYLYEEALSQDEGWNLIVDANQRKNPAYPFADYYWAWKSSHDLIFTVLGAEAPEADIFHAVSTGFAGLAALAAQIRTGKPFLLTEHGLYHKEREMEIRKTNLVKGYQRDMWIRLYDSLSRICYRRADWITALFEENRRKQWELGAPAEKSEVIPNGIDIRRFKIERQEREGFHVGLVGRVVPIKDIKTFIAMARLVADRIPEARFYCIGPTDEDPGYYNDCRLLVQSLKLEECFSFTDRQNVLDYYSFLDVLCLTSVREAQPLVILEAYCAGVPVVATRVGNVAELLNFDDRFLAPPRDAAKLAEGVLAIRDGGGEIAGLVEANRARTEEFYDKEELHQRYRDLYRRFKPATGGGA